MIRIEDLVSEQVHFVQEENLKVIELILADPTTPINGREVFLKTPNHKLLPI